MGLELGPYRIEARLGDGGMGWVCRAFDGRDGGQVAIKFLPPHLRSDGRSVARFEEEANVERAIQHPNVCQVLDVGRDDELGPYIVMPFYEGETLRQVLDRGPMDPVGACSVAAQVARGLEAAHALDVTHRDVKPGNVLLLADRAVRILDFGAAKQSDLSLTETGKILGTVTYMAPEQIVGETVSPATDLWALGVLLQEMFTGRHPFRERSLAATVRRVLAGRPDPLRPRALGVPDSVDALLAALLERDPRRRPSATTTAERLEAVV